MHITRFVRIGAAGLVLGLAGGGVARGQSEGAPDPALRAYQTASGFLARGMNGPAAEEYRKFLSEHPAHEKARVARYGLGVALFRQKEYGAAEAELKQAAGGGKDFEFGAETGLLLGQCQLALDKPADGAETLERTLEGYSSSKLSPDAAALRVECLYRAQKRAEALKAADEHARKWPQSPLRGRVELFAGLSLMADDPAGASKRFEGAIQAEKKRGEGEGGADAASSALRSQASLLLAQCLLRSGDAEKARRQYQQIIDGPASAVLPDALFGMAGLLVDQQGDGAQERGRAAGELLDRLIKEFPQSPLLADARLLRARVYFDSGDYKRAAAMFEKAGGEAGDSADAAAYWLAKCELRAGHAERAAEQLGEAITRFPESRLMPEMLYDRAVALLRAGDKEGAVSAIEEFTRRFADHALAPEALQLGASALHQAAKYDKSLELCREFSTRFPQHALAPTVAFVAAENELLLQDEDGAAEAYRVFLQKYPSDAAAPRAAFRLGTLLARAGKNDEARPLLERVAEGRKTAEMFRPALLSLADIAFAAQDWSRCEAFCTDFLSFGDEQPGADDAMLKLGLAQQRRGDNAAAVRSFDRLLEKFDSSPHRLHALFERGQALVALGKGDKAAESFERVLQVSEASKDKEAARFAPYAHNHLGAIAMGAGKHEEAAEHFRAAAKSAAGTDFEPEATFQEALALAAAGENEKGAGLFEHVAKDFPRHARAGEAAARAAIARAREGGEGANADALAAIEKAEREHAGDIDPALRDALAYERAWSLRRLGRGADAERVLRTLVDSGKASGDLRLHAMLDLAELRIDAKDYPAAAELLRAVRATPESAGQQAPAPLLQRATYQLGVCAFRQERFDEAAKLMQEFLGKDPDKALVPSAALVCGESLFKLGRHKQAADNLRRVVDEFKDAPACPAAMLRLGEALGALQTWPESQRVFAAYLERFKDSELWFQAQFGLGWALENQKQYDGAMAAYRTVVERHQGPTAARAQFQIGECLFAQKKLDEAAKELLKVDILYAYPEWSAAALFEAGRCFEELKDAPRARELYQQVQDKHAQSKWAQLASQRIAGVKAPAPPR